MSLKSVQVTYHLVHTFESDAVTSDTRMTACNQNNKQTMSIEMQSYSSATETCH